MLYTAKKVVKWLKKLVVLLRRLLKPWGNTNLKFTFLTHYHRIQNVHAAEDVQTREVVSRMTSSYSSSPETPQRKKRSVELVDESGQTYVNGTVEDHIRMLYAFDANCDSYIDVTEWAKLAPVDQFLNLLNFSDVNGKCGFKPNSHGLLTLPPQLPPYDKLIGSSLSCKSSAC